ncbi:MAG: AMP-binding protein, partial [Rhizobacter sp.]
MQERFARDFGVITDLVRYHAEHSPERAALVDPSQTLTYRELDALMDRIAATLQRDGLQPGDAIAICATMTVPYAAVFLGALRAGVVVAPLAPGSTPASLARMQEDAAARLLFVDASTVESTGAAGQGGPRRIRLDTELDGWLLPEGSQPAPVTPEPSWPFNIIYSSGTTGDPKGIVQGHGMRWAHVRRGATYQYGGPDGVTLLSTP